MMSLMNGNGQTWKEEINKLKSENAALRDQIRQRKESSDDGQGREGLGVLASGGLDHLAVSDSRSVDTELRLQQELAEAREMMAGMAKVCEQHRADLDRFQQEQQELRQLLWLNHQHSSAEVYGDDGEMQCNDRHQNGEDHLIGVLDFKRQPLLELASAICSMLRFHARRGAADGLCRDPPLLLG